MAKKIIVEDRSNLPREIAKIFWKEFKTFVKSDEDLCRMRAIDMYNCVLAAFDIVRETMDRALNEKLKEDE